MLFNNGVFDMSNELKFEYEGLEVSITYDPATDRIKRTVTESGTEIYNDELTFDKSVLANYGAISVEEQAKIATAWGSAGFKTRIEEGQIGGVKK